MKRYIGIDLGTTESTLSAIEIEKRSDKPMEKLRGINIFQYNRNHEPDKSNRGLQSSLYIDRETGVVYVGEYAKKIYSDGSKPLQTVRSVKTRIGGESMIDVPLERDKSDLLSFDMTQLSAFLLKSIYNSIEQQGGEDMEAVTITIPAGFNSDERRATVEAAEIAGFKEINLLDEPTAVLLNFLNSDNSLEFGDRFFATDKRVLIYDIGGGTLDISIANVLSDDGDFKLSILGRSERMDFGGDDIDKYIASYFLEEFEKINRTISDRTPEEQAVIVSRIVSHAEKHKISLSKKIANSENEKKMARVKERVNFEVIDSLSVRDITLTDNSLREILSDVISAHGKLLNPVEKTLRRASLHKSDIDIVVITGGSGKFYLVEETLRKYFSHETKIVDFTERDAVSKGAAIHSYNFFNEKLKKIDISDIMSDSIFIKKRDRFEKIVPHDAEAPSTGRYFYKFEEPSTRVDIFLYYGVDGEQNYKFREIAGAFKELDRVYETGEEIELQWELSMNRIIKIFMNGEEVVSASGREEKSMLKKFQIR
jgi:molecular chaperone DnaK